MKKSIVLLISLFFISALSILILQNLDSTNSYIKEQNYKIQKIQTLAIIDNFKREASKVIEQYGDNLSDIKNIPLNIEGIDALFSLSIYDKKDVNLLVHKEEKKYKEIEQLFSDNDVGNFDNFRYLFRGNNKVNNYKQLDAIIDTFIKEVYNDDILLIKDKLGFLLYDTENQLYELKINVNYLEEFASANYILDKNGMVKYFELSFK